MKLIRSGQSALLGAVLMGAAGLLGGGCATGTTLLKISHEPLVKAPQKREGTILVRPFVDKRKETAYIGNKRNGYGMVLGHVNPLPGVKIEEVLTQYFMEALQEAGYKAELLAEPPAAGVKADAIVEGDIVEFWMDLYMKVWHRVKVQVRALDPKTLNVVFDKEIAGAENRMLWAGVTAEYERIVRQAITKALNQAVAEFSSDEFDAAIRKKEPAGKKPSASQKPPALETPNAESPPEGGESATPAS